MFCDKSKRADEWIVDIYLHIIILLIVLSTAFWVYLSKVETKSLQGEVEQQIDNIIKNSDDNKILSSIDYNELLKIFNGKTSFSVKDHNKSLKKLNIIIILLLIFSFFVIWLILSVNCGKCVPVGKILLENIGLFIFIGMIEIVFFLKIASKYVPVEPSFMAQTVIDYLNKTLS
jgi:hypothetical protein